MHFQLRITVKVGKLGRHWVHELGACGFLWWFLPVEGANLTWEGPALSHSTSPCQV